MQQQEEEDTPGDQQVASDDTNPDDDVSSTSQNPAKNASNQKIVHVWFWKETPSQIYQHPPGSIVGDPSDGWIRYGRISNQKLEAAYQQNDTTTTTCCDLGHDYEVNLTTMKQINKHTRFQREVQRTVETPKVWCWKETQGLMWKHDPSTIYGNPSDCWILYKETVSDLLEQAFQDGEEEVSTSNGFVVNLDDMIQTNEATGFERDVQRVDAKDNDDSNNDDEQPQPDTSSSAAAAVAGASPPAPKKVWCWKETDGFQWRHDPSTVHGDPSNSCWIKYDEEASEILEDAFQTQPFGIVSPCEGYNVNLAIMKQVNIATGFERDVQRVDPIEDEEEEDADDESEEMQIWAEEQDALTVIQAQRLERSLKRQMYTAADRTLQAVSEKFEERLNHMENELKLVRTELQETRSEFKQTTQERDELKEEIVAMKDTLEALKKSVDLLVQQQKQGPGTAKQADLDHPSSDDETKKRSHSDLLDTTEESEPNLKKQAFTKKIF